jgi:hypothetical protein
MLVQGVYRRGGGPCSLLVRLKASATQAATLTLVPLRVLAQKIAVGATIAGAVALSVEDAVVGVALDVNGFTEIETRRVAWRVIGISWSVSFVLRRGFRRDFGLA